jgi:hypothetical protein
MTFEVAIKYYSADGAEHELFGVYQASNLENAKRKAVAEFRMQYPAANLITVGAFPLMTHDAP